MKFFIAISVCWLLFLSCNQPKVENLKFEGEPIAKNVFRVSFDLSDSAIHYKINWLISDPATDGWKELPGIHSKEIVLLTEYVGKHLKCEIEADGNSKSVSIATETPVVFKGNPNTDWFKNAGVGVMLHFLKSIFAKDGGSKEWNDAVNGFDVDLFAENCKEAGAGFVMFALGQNDGYYCSPNAVYDSVVGVKPGEFCSVRDLPADLFNALDKRGIRMMFYLPGNPPISNELVDQKFQYTYGKDSPTSQFTQACWESVIKEWSLRYGQKNSGWWFDGMYRKGIIETRSDMSLAHNISTHTLAAKAGNPNCIVTYNYGVNKIQTDSPYDDYSAGEENNIGQLPENRWVVDGAQWFLFTYLGKWWGGGETRYNTAELTDWAEKVFEKQGVLCFDIHADKTGAIAPEHIAQVKAIREKLEKVKRNQKSL
jgi:hypothetical protein